MAAYLQTRENISPHNDVVRYSFMQTYVRLRAEEDCQPIQRRPIEHLWFGHSMIDCIVVGSHRNEPTNSCSTNERSYHEHRRHDDAQLVRRLPRARIFLLHLTNRPNNDRTTSDIVSTKRANEFLFRMNNSNVIASKACRYFLVRLKNRFLCHNNKINNSNNNKRDFRVRRNP